MQFRRRDGDAIIRQCHAISIAFRHLECTYFLNIDGDLRLSSRYREMRFISPHVLYLVVITGEFEIKMISTMHNNEPIRGY